jgi:4-hydroxyphenylpyruvate dioxygenase
LKTYDVLRANGLKFMTPPPNTYYEMLEERVPGHGWQIEELQKCGILLDGVDGKYLLQIFTQTLIGPIFFEIIERQGDEGFGQGNFRALFVSMERDQVRRGVLKAR